jgi:hypothetical protein
MLDAIGRGMVRAAGFVLALVIFLWRAITGPRMP